MQRNFFYFPINEQNIAFPVLFKPHGVAVLERGDVVPIKLSINLSSDQAYCITASECIRRCDCGAPCH